MNLSRIVLLSVLAVLALAAAEGGDEEVPEESLSQEHDGEMAEGDDEVPGEGDDEGAVQGDTFALSEEQIGNMLKKIDFNGDGKASLDELKLFAQNSAMISSKKYFDEQYTGEYTPRTIDKHLEDEHGSDAPEFEREKLVVADTNKDGKLDKDEHFQIYSGSNKDVLAIEANFKLKEMDANKDGFLDIDEFTKGNFQGFGPDGEPEDEATNAEMQQDSKSQFSLLDKDGNGKLNGGEYASWFSQHHQDELDSVFLVEGADANKDGFLDLKELVDYVGSHENEYHVKLGKGLFETWAQVHGESTEL
eukprot:TRINITY_DN863_c0_g1_i2.p1 TRINITY_DN863_c0_g1~~TRINITY_DN863_c0_g1_i2.p1  ORF type:complete len:305 (-),score=76.73 TRINITY_DN863_c0_g1_i2:140-1054(-)